MCAIHRASNLAFTGRPCNGAFR